MFDFTQNTMPYINSAAMINNWKYKNYITDELSWQWD